MSLTWHIVRKDFRRMRWPLAAWLVLPLVEWALISRASDAAMEPSAIENMATMAGVWTGLSWFGGLILAAWLVMEDSLVSTRAFWQSRPISPVRLLAAKTVGALLMFAVLPALVMALVWASAGFSVHDMAWCAVELALKQLIFVVAGIALATVAETAGRLFVTLIVTTVAVPVVVGYCAGIFASGIKFDGDGLVETRYRLVMGIFFLLPLVMIAHQYLTRRTRRTYAILIVGILLALIIRLTWSWDLSGVFRRFPAEETRGNLGITFTAEPLAIEPGHNPMMVFVRGTTANVPAGSYVDFKDGRGWWSDASGRWPGEKYLPKMEAPLERAALEVLGSSQIPAQPATWRLSTLVRDETVTRTVKNSSQLQVAVEAILMRGGVMGELPLRAGAVLRAGTTRVRVVSVERHEQQLVISLEQRLPWPPWTRRAQDVFLLRSPAVASGIDYLGDGERGVAFNGIALRLRQFSLPVPLHEVNGRSVEVPDWEKDARLVMVRFSPDVWFTPILADGQSIKPAP